MRRALVVLALALSAPAAGLACGNAVQLSTQEQNRPRRQGRGPPRSR
ncbi:MAG: hypothetical protein R3F60_27600 [bacterium]